MMSVQLRCDQAKTKLKDLHFSASTEDLGIESNWVEKPGSDGRVLVRLITYKKNIQVYDLGHEKILSDKASTC